MEKSNKECLCGSGVFYEKCCKPFHEGKIPQTAVELMRSRYAAYALNLSNYIIQTTHPGSPQYQDDRKKWAQQISEFSLSSRFLGVDVLSAHEDSSIAVVVFVAKITQNKQDVTFTEKSYFEKFKGRWLYRSGHLAEGHAPNLMTVSQPRLLPLAYYGDPILRRKADPITEISSSIRKLVEEMIETMDACDGVGLAAPQVHHSIRLFVTREILESEDGRGGLGKVEVFINPVLLETKDKTWKAQEGCLSIPAIHGDVERPEEIVVEYLNLEGQKIKKHLSGWNAKVFLHENDHINGVLFIDLLSKEERDFLEPFLQKMHHRIHDGTEL